MDGETRPACRLCGFREHWLVEHLETHGLTPSTYLERFPGAPLASAGVLTRAPALHEKLQRAHPPPPEGLTIEFAGVHPRVNHDVPERDCLVRPKAYRLPTHGELGKDIREAVIALLLGRTTYLWGLPGTGKDALIHAWSSYTRTPGLIFQIEPEADIRAWFFAHEFDQNGTSWEEGVLLRALRDGYTTTTGRRIPYLILFTDFDRATKEQAESLRLVTDSIQGRVKGPSGVTYDMLPGTQIVVTANTPGGGDVRGRCISANVIDASILDRFERAFEFHWMDWEDEGPIVKEKFPLLVQRCPPALLANVGKATAAIRAAIKSDELYAEFSHRALCAWLGQAEDIITVSNQVPPDLLKRAFRVYADKLPDKEARDTAMRLADPYIRGGTI